MDSFDLPDDVSCDICGGDEFLGRLLPCSTFGCKNRRHGACFDPPIGESSAYDPLYFCKTCSPDDVVEEAVFAPVPMASNVRRYGKHSLQPRLAQRARPLSRAAAPTQAGARASLSQASASPSPRPHAELSFGSSGSLQDLSLILKTEPGDKSQGLAAHKPHALSPPPLHDVLAPLNQHRVAEAETELRIGREGQLVAMKENEGTAQAPSPTSTLPIASNPPSPPLHTQNPTLHDVPHLGTLVGIEPTPQPNFTSAVLPIPSQNTPSLTLETPSLLVPPGVGGTTAHAAPPPQPGLPTTSASTLVAGPPSGQHAPEGAQRQLAAPEPAAHDDNMDVVAGQARAGGAGAGPLDLAGGPSGHPVAAALSGFGPATVVVLEEWSKPVLVAKIQFKLWSPDGTVFMEKTTLDASGISPHPAVERLFRQLEIVSRAPAKPLDLRPVALASLPPHLAKFYDKTLKELVGQGNRALHMDGLHVTHPRSYIPQGRLVTQYFNDIKGEEMVLRHAVQPPNDETLGHIVGAQDPALYYVPLESGRLLCINSCDEVVRSGLKWSRDKKPTASGIKRRSSAFLVPGPKELCGALQKAFEPNSDPPDLPDPPGPPAPASSPSPPASPSSAPASWQPNLSAASLEKAAKGVVSYWIRGGVPRARPPLPPLPAREIEGRRTRIGLSQAFRERAADRALKERDADEGFALRRPGRPLPGGPQQPAAKRPRLPDPGGPGSAAAARDAFPGFGGGSSQGRAFGSQIEVPSPSRSGPLERVGSWDSGGAASPAAAAAALDLASPGAESAEGSGFVAGSAFGGQIEVPPPRPQPLQEGGSWRSGVAPFSVAPDPDLLALINGPPAHQPQPLQQGQQQPAPAPCAAPSLDVGLSLVRSLPSLPCTYTSQPPGAAQRAPAASPLARLVPQCLHTLAGRLGGLRVLYVPSLADQQRMEQSPSPTSDEWRAKLAKVSLCTTVPGFSELEGSCRQLSLWQRRAACSPGDYDLVVIPEALVSSGDLLASLPLDLRAFALSPALMAAERPFLDALLEARRQVVGLQAAQQLLLAPLLARSQLYPIGMQVFLSGEVFHATPLAHLVKLMECMSLAPIDANALRTHAGLKPHAPPAPAHGAPPADAPPEGDCFVVRMRPAEIDALSCLGDQGDNELRLHLLYHYLDAKVILPLLPSECARVTRESVRLRQADVAVEDAALACSQQRRQARLLAAACTPDLPGEHKEAAAQASLCAQTSAASKQGVLVGTVEEINLMLQRLFDRA